MLSYSGPGALTKRKLGYAELCILKKEEIKMMMQVRELHPYVIGKDANGNSILKPSKDLFASFNRREDFVNFMNEGCTGPDPGYPRNIRRLNTIYASKEIDEEDLVMMKLDDEDARCTMGDVISSNQITIHSVHWLLDGKEDSAASINDICYSFAASDRHMKYRVKDIIAVVDVGISTKSENDLKNTGRQNKVKLFHTFELSNPEKHHLSSTFRKLEKQERDDILGKLGTMKQNSALPKINSTDRVIKYNNWENKDVLKVVSQSYGLNTYMETAIEYLIVN